MAEGVPKGTVTSLSSVFPVDEAQKAAKRVQETIADRQKELTNLQRFMSDNNALLNLVQTLPDELSHDIMVPFGKAAFFPGRLIHTNEFLVLLGEGYYAERSSKQTTEILHRRGKVLESQVESLKATMLDLQAKASFFNTTAAEAAEGLVEIREDCVEEKDNEMKSNSGAPKSNSVGSSEADKRKLVVSDEEYAQIMSRFDELEKEEREASENDEDDDFESVFGCSDDQLKDPIQKFMDDKLFSSATSEPSSGNRSHMNFTEKSTTSNHNPFQFEDMKSHLVVEDESSHGKNSAYIVGKSSVVEKPKVPSKSKDETAHSAPKVEEAPITSPPKIEKDSGDNAVDRAYKMSSDRRRAFTGSIVEHSHGLPSNTASQSCTSSQASGPNPSKPVSRFKMQKGGH